MAEIWTMGEMLVEIMRDTVGASLGTSGVFKGPYASGAPAIFIDTVAKLGGTAGMIGSVGNDDFGECIVGKLQSDGVDCSNVIKSNELSTGCAFVTYFEDGSRKFIYHIANTAATLSRGLSKMPKDAKIFHIMGCSLTAEPNFGRRIIDTMNVFSLCGAKITFDPNIRPELMKDEKCMSRIQDVMEKTNIFMPGKSELLMLTNSKSIEEACEKCFSNYNMEMIVVKNGSSGSMIFTKDMKYSFGIYKVDPVDATGAGDSFDGAFLTSLIKGKSIEDCAKIASAAAALNTAEFGPMEGKISPASVSKMISEGGCI